MRPTLYAPAILACGALLACGGGSIDSPPGLGASFRCADSAPATNHVVLRCAGQVASDEWRIDVVVGVPTASSTIREFNFDMVFDPLLLAFVPGSEEQGNILNQDGATVWLAAGTATNPDDPGRLLVGTYRMSATGVAGVSGHERIMSFRIKALTMMPFGPEMPTFENAEARDSLNQVVPEIAFSDQLLFSVE